MPAAKPITVRMYTSGRADCFLVEIPPRQGDPQTRRILIDCGLQDAAKLVVKDAAIGEQGAAPRIDVVVVTHRHDDHVRGFAAPEWKDVKVSEVWLPWTEDPNDELARYVRVRQSSTRDDLISILRGQDEPDLALIEQALLSLSADDGMNALEAGIDQTIRPTKRYLPELPPPASPAPAAATTGDAAAPAPLTSLASDALPGVEIHVLGPPRDVKQLAKKHIPKDKRYVRMFGGAPTVAGIAAERARQRKELLELREKSLAAQARGDRVSGRADAQTYRPLREWHRPLFRESWVVDPAVYPADPDPELPSLDGASREAVCAADAYAALGLAASLEETENGTSVVLMFRVGSAHLLFTGDAEWGTWEKGVETWRWLLNRTTFFKVGHHGSFNASPKPLVEALPSNFMAMVPTEQNGNVPNLKLMTALSAKPASVVMSTFPNWQGWQANPLPANFYRRPDGAIEAYVKTEG